MNTSRITFAARHLARTAAVAFWLAISLIVITQVWSSAMGEALAGTPPQNAAPPAAPKPRPKTSPAVPAATARESGKDASPADDAQSLLAQAQSALDRNDFTAAIPLLQQIAAQRPAEALPHFELGYAYSELKRNVEAVAEYRRAIALDSGLSAAHINLGLVLLSTDPNSAAESFLRAAALLPEQARPHYLAGQALESANKLPEAIAEYTSAVNLAPKEAPMRFALARCLLKAGRSADAEASFRQAIALASATPAESAGANGKTTAAAGVQQAQLGLAEALVQERKWAAAIEAFDAYLAGTPNDRAVRFERAVALHELNRFDEALAELDRADAGASPTPDSLKLRGSIFMQQNKWSQARASLEKAAADLPLDAELHAWLGHVDVELKDLPPAERELRRSLTLKPSPEALGDLVNVYYFAERYEEALAALDLLAKEQTLTPINWFFRAICCDKLKRTADAAAAYQKFLGLDQGAHPDQDFQARQRLKLLQRELKRK